MKLKNLPAGPAPTTATRGGLENVVRVRLTHEIAAEVHNLKVVIS